MTRIVSAVGGGMIYSTARELLVRICSRFAAFSPDRRFWLKLAGTLQVALATQAGMLGLPLAESDQRLAAPGLLALAVGFIGGVLLVVMGFSDRETKSKPKDVPSAPGSSPRSSIFAASPLVPVMGLLGHGMPSLSERIEMELRRPVTAILSFASALETELAERRLADGYRGAVQRIRQGGSDLLTAVEEFAVLARPDEGPATPASARTGLRSVVGDAVHALAPMAQQCGVRLVRQDDGDLVVRGESGALHQVAVHVLAMQIRRAMPGETIVVSHVAERTEARLICRASGGRARPAHAQQLCGEEPLALATARGLIERLGGRLATSVGRDTGLTVSLHIPLAQARRTRAFRLADTARDLMPRGAFSAAARPAAGVA